MPEKEGIDNALQHYPTGFSPNDIRLSSQSTHTTPIMVRVLKSCPSTNALLLSEAPPSPLENPPIQVVVAHHQTAGRGQYGRTWFDHPEHALIFSLSWPLPPHCESLPVYAAVAMSIAATEALIAQGFSGIGLKWPNDLLWQKRKLAGLLLEQKKGLVVLGIGINALPMPTIGPPTESAFSHASCVSLAEIAKNAERTLEINGSQIIALLIHHFNKMFSTLLTSASRSFKPLHMRWQTLDIAKHQSVDFYPTQAAPLLNATYLGLDEDAALMLRPEKSRVLQRHHTGKLILYRCSIHKSTRSHIAHEPTGMDL